MILKLGMSTLNQMRTLARFIAGAFVTEDSGFSFITEDGINFINESDE